MSQVLLSTDVLGALRYLESVQPARDALGLPAIIQPLRPVNLSGWHDWTEMVTEQVRLAAYSIEGWYCRGHEVRAISAVELVAQEEGGERLEYHISISRLPYLKQPKRASSSLARWALRQFGAEGFLEDNHVPSGIVRNYWRPLNDAEVGKVCKCVESEPAIREMKGDFTWRGVPPAQKSP